MPKTLLKLKILFLGSLTTYLLFTAPPALAYELEVKLPGLPASVSDPGEYVRYLFIFGLSLAGFLAVGAVAVGGIKYILAGSSVGNVTDARNLIVGALMGVGLLLGSYLLLYTIDPSLTNLSPRVPPIGNVAAPPKEQAGVDYGKGQTTATTQTFIYAITAQMKGTSVKGCLSLAGADFDLCVAQNACNKLASELSQTKNQTLIGIQVNADKCTVVLKLEKNNQ